jgi:exodeoxyribonuclease VII large subunit
LRPRALELSVSHGAERVKSLTARLKRESGQLLTDRAADLARLGGLLTSYSYENVLARGFAVIRDEAGVAVMNAAATRPGMAVELGFADGAVPATIGARGGTAAQAPVTKRRSKPKDSGGNGGQGTLL